MAAYLNIGHEFQFRHNDFKGTVVASTDAFYFVITKYGLADAPTGLLGDALVALNRHTGAKASDTCFTGDLSELPREVAEHPDWPVRQKSGKVLTIPRAGVTSVRLPGFWLNNRVYVSAGDLEIGTVYNLLRRGKIKRFLAEKGWTERA